MAVGTSGRNCISCSSNWHSMISSSKKWSVQLVPGCARVLWGELASQTSPSKGLSVRTLRGERQSQRSV